MKSAAERISRLVRLTARERRLLFRAWWELLIVDAALRILPVTRLLARTPPPLRSTPPLPLERIGWLLDVARRYSPVRTTCLKEAIVLVRTLRAEGVDAAVKIGVARHAGELRAHAWVEHRGHVILGSSEAESYVRLGTVSGTPVAR